MDQDIQMLSHDRGELVGTILSDPSVLFLSDSDRSCLLLTHSVHPTEKNS